MFEKFDWEFILLSQYAPESKMSTRWMMMSFGAFLHGGVASWYYANQSDTMHQSPEKGKKIRYFIELIPCMENSHKCKAKSRRLQHMQCDYFPQDLGISTFGQEEILELD